MRDACWPDYIDRTRGGKTIAEPPWRAAVIALSNRKRAITFHIIIPILVSKQAFMSGNRNLLYLVIGALIVAVGVLGYNLYQSKKQPEGVQINVGPGGLKIQSK